MYLEILHMIILKKKDTSLFVQKLCLRTMYIEANIEIDIDLKINLELKIYLTL